MAFGKKARPTVDKDGAALVMRGRDYLADFSGQLGLGIMANLVGQLHTSTPTKSVLQLAR